MKVKRIKLKLMIIFALIVILNFKNEFILISKARETKSYDPVVRAMVTIEDMAETTDELSRYSIEELQSMYDEITSDINRSIMDTNQNMNDYATELDEGDIGDATVIQEYLEVLIKEKERVEFFNDVLRQAVNINTNVYSQENIDTLNSLIVEISARYNNDEYWRRARRILGKTLRTGVTSVTSANENEAQRLISNLDSKIRLIELHRLDIQQGDTEEIPLEIDTDLYDPSQSPISDASLDWLVVKNNVQVVLGAIRNISVVVAVISLMIIGIKYIFGSVEEKANYKQTLVPYVIGILLITSGTVIVSAIFNIFN